MAKRIHEMEAALSEIKEKGINKKIHLDLTMDGYEMVKKKPVAGNDISPEEHINNLLCVLTDRERTVMVYRYGLCGTKPQAYREIAKKLAISTERIRQIMMKALRKIRKQENEHLVKKITHMQLKFDILGGGK
jgi:DNA-directed RNA polymerase sigma subunit (sigma70/sigma32)